MIEILFATSNAGKAREVQAMFSDLDVDVKTLKEDGISVDVEENGKTSVFPKAHKAPLTPDDMKIPSDENGISHLIILDGSVIQKDLDLLGWDQNKLSKELRRRSLSPDQIFIMTVDDSGRITVIPKEIK